MTDYPLFARAQGSSALHIVTVLQPKVVRLVNYLHRQNCITPPVTFETLL